MSGSKIDSLDVDDREGIALLDSQNKDTQMIEGTKKIRSERMSINAIRLLSESICKRNVLIGFLRSRRQTERETHTRSDGIHFLLNGIDRFFMIGRWASEFPSLRLGSRNTERITRSDPNVPRRTPISLTIRSVNSFCQYLRLFGRVNTNTPTSELG